jgi:hypothetical protein
MRVPVEQITRERLMEWLQGCVRAHATPVVLIAVGHDERSGEVHVFRPDGGFSDPALQLLVMEVAARMTADV